MFHSLHYKFSLYRLSTQERIEYYKWSAAFLFSYDNIIKIYYNESQFIMKNDILFWKYPCFVNLNNLLFLTGIVSIHIWAQLRKCECALYSRWMFNGILLFFTGKQRIVYVSCWQLLPNWVSLLRGIPFMHSENWSSRIQF